jgi:hypothetical protein
MNRRYPAFVFFAAFFALFTLVVLLRGENRQDTSN